MSPTSISRMFSSVTTPAMPPCSSSTTAICMRRRRISASKERSDKPRGTANNSDARSSTLTSARCSLGTSKTDFTCTSPTSASKFCASGEFSAVLDVVLVDVLAVVLSTTGKREKPVATDSSAKSAAVAVAVTATTSVRGMNTSAVVLAANRRDAVRSSASSGSKVPSSLETFT